MYFLGIDLGTSSVKIILIDEKGKLMASVSKEYPVYYPKPGWSEQNPKDWWDAVKIGLNDLANKNSVLKDNIKAIGLSGQMHGLVALDNNGEILNPAILWNDQRTQEECDYLNDIVGRDFLTLHTGNKALTGFTAPKILWLKKHKKDIYNRISHILLPKDYIRYKLTGEYATDVSDASGTLLFNVKKRKWSDKMMEVVGIGSNILPKCYESYEITGKVSTAAADETGLKPGIPVIGGGGDQACGAVGVGAVKSGVISVALGTSGVVFACQDEYVADKENRLHSFCHANGKWHVMGVMLSAASCLKWWIENIQQNKCKDAYDVLLEEASKAPLGSNGLIFLPYLTGERTPYSDPNAKGSFIGFNIMHNRGHATRSILEGVTFGLRDSLEIVRDLKINIDSVRLIGGGAKSPLWRKIVADIFNSRVNIVNSTEGPALGAAILAAVGAGYYSTVEEACRNIIKVEESVYPEEYNVQAYNGVYPIYHGLYDTLKDTFPNL